MRLPLLTVGLLIILDSSTPLCNGLAQVSSKRSLFNCPSKTSGFNRCNVCLSASLNSIDKSNNNSDDDDDQLGEKLKGDDREEEALVKRKKKGKQNGGYKVLDNRDSLPFVVKVATPDPYTSPAKMRKEARAISKEQKKEQQKKEKQKKNKMSPSEYAKKKKKNPHDLLLGQKYARDDGISASVKLRQKDGSLHKILGEFTLSPNTNCGDLLEVGQQEYEVLRAHSQYRYAGGKRFVMVRKILEVKEVTRIAEENYLKRQFAKDTGISNPDDSEPPSLE